MPKPETFSRRASDKNRPYFKTVKVPKTRKAPEAPKPEAPKPTDETKK